MFTGAGATGRRMPSSPPLTAVAPGVVVIVTERAAAPMRYTASTLPTLSTTAIVALTLRLRLGDCLRDDLLNIRNRQARRRSAACAAASAGGIGAGARRNRIAAGAGSDEHHDREQQGVFFMILAPRQRLPVADGTSDSSRIARPLFRRPDDRRGTPRTCPSRQHQVLAVLRFLRLGHGQHGAASPVSLPWIWWLR